MFQELFGRDPSREKQLRIRSEYVDGRTFNMDFDPIDTLEDKQPPIL